MKKYLFHSLMTVALWAMSMPVMAEDCSILKGAAQILYQQQRWDIVKMECETYLKQCGYDAEIQKMLDDCNRHLNGSQTKPADKPQPKETPKETPKQSPKPAAQPAPPVPPPVTYQKPQVYQAPPQQPVQHCPPTQQPAVWPEPPPEIRATLPSFLLERTTTLPQSSLRTYWG